MVVKHNKTGNLYQLIDDCKAKINGEWIDAVIYHGKDKATGKIKYLVREISDFNNHFIEVDDIKPNSEYSWLIYRIYALKEVAAEYSGKTIENVIAQMEARRKEISSSTEEQ